MPSKPLRTSLSMPRMPWMFHPSFERRRNRTQLDLTMLGDGRDASSQAAGQADQYHLDRRGALVFGGEDLGMVGVEVELGLVLMVLAEPEVFFDGGPALGAVHPLARRSPFELGALRLFRQRFACAEQRFDVHAVIDWAFCGGHGLLLMSLKTGDEGIPTPSGRGQYTCFRQTHNRRVGFRAGIEREPLHDVSFPFRYPEVISSDQRQ